MKPFDQGAILRGEDGIARYQNLPNSLLEMLRRTVERVPETEALVQIGGERISYRDLWDRSARVAGGLRDAGIQNGDRVAIRLANGTDWCLAFFGTLMAGATVVPVNTRFSDSEVEYVLKD